MKTATLPSLRVTPELRQAIEAVLQEDETLSSFMKQTLRREIGRRKAQANFIDHTLAALDDAERTGVDYSFDHLPAELRDMLDESQAKAKRIA